MRLPSSWGNSNIHSSLLVSLGLISAAVFAVSFTRAGLAELRPLALTLPAVWVLSLVVRIAAQQLAIGGYSHELQTTVGPTGNLSTDYEYLPPRQMFLYASAGQLASCGLLILGLIVNAVLLPVGQTEVQLAELLDVHGGWTSRAWATQIMWVNAFIGVLNLLPTIPFDMRALVFAIATRKRLQAHEPQVLRQIAKLDTHLAAGALGAGLCIWLVGWSMNLEFPGWYALVAAAVYLFVASRWEVSRAEELEKQYMPLATYKVHAPSMPLNASHVSFELEQSSESGQDIASPLPSPIDLKEDRILISEADLDNILRKLHREGSESLSPHEQEALLTASRELQEKRRGG
ncbi:MAG: M50 family metallopeptidase [Planctomycetales bacterium]|nr:M50 family metallopeptidase [Planctomycetales bacterium]